MELNNKSVYPELCIEILEELQEKLPDVLSYHSIAHTLDVANVCDYYINQYNIQKPEADLIRIAAVAHDYGYLFGPESHEEKSIVAISARMQNDYSQEEIEIVAGIIRATKIPQDPQNFYEQILADADLDYLGRDDYNQWSERLYQEFLHFGVVKDSAEWLDVQIKFLEKHQFHTDLAKENRSKLKKEKLQELQELKKLTDSKF